MIVCVSLGVCRCAGQAQLHAHSDTHTITEHIAHSLLLHTVDLDLDLDLGTESAGLGLGLGLHAKAKTQ